MKIKIGIIGGAGYTGGELIRLLINHPFADIQFINSRSNAGKLVSTVHQDLVGETNLLFSDAYSNDINLLFLCLGHGESKKFLAENQIDEHVKIIDLANDFRLSSTSQFDNRIFVYGLPELNREQIKAATAIANPVVLLLLFS
jgi:N-acetyl-gamma-glutamyl-phosphate reductase